jgi:hypothetical protein
MWGWHTHVYGMTGIIKRHCIWHTSDSSVLALLQLLKLLARDVDDEGSGEVPPGVEPQVLTVVLYHVIKCPAALHTLCQNSTYICTPADCRPEGAGGADAVPIGCMMLHVGACGKAPFITCNASTWFMILSMI